VCVDEVITI